MANPMDQQNIQEIMAQAQRVQSEMDKLQKELEKRVYEASSDCGRVKIKSTGKKKVLSINIDPDFVTAENAAQIESIVTDTLNKLMIQIETQITQEVNQITGGRI